ncbi:MAG TPA: GxxExxY protein [Chitinophagaceae bacterium]|nr:GxxExxY protein [Chitinophagaceae bacterium]
MRITQKYLDELTYQIIGAAIEVHKHLGPGLLESAYHKCFLHELFLRGLKYESQRNVVLNYKEITVDTDLRYDVLVEDQIVTELKSTEGIALVHQFITLTYMRFLEKAKGVIINFNVTNIFKEGQKTLVNDLYGKLPRE